MLNEYSSATPGPAVPLATLVPAPAARYRSSAPDLVARAARGEAQALARLVEEQRGRIVALARFFTGRVEDAEDLAHDILLRLVQALPRLGATETFDVWVYRLSRNRCVDHFRRRRMEAGWPPHGEPESVMWRPESVPADEALEASQASVRLHAAIRALPPVWREVSRLNPFFYMIDGFRYGFFGVSDVAPAASLAVVSASLVAVSFACLALLRSGYKLRH